MDGKSRILGGVKPVRTRGRKARREGGGILTHPRDEKFIRSVPEYDEQSIRSVFEHDEAPSKDRGSDKAIREIAPSGLRAIFG